MTATPLPTSLNHVLHAATRRIRLLLLARNVSWALCGAAALALLLLAAGKLRLMETPAPGLLFGLIALGMVAGIVSAFVPRLSELDVARLTERRAGLKERLSSAVEFTQQGSDNAIASLPFYAEQFADANRYAETVNVKSLYPLRVPRPFWFGLVACLALLGAYFLPSLPLFWSPEHKQEMAEVKRQGIALVKLAEDKQKTAETQKLDETKKAAAEARKLGEAMRKQKLDKKQALVAMQKLTQKMEAQQRELAQKSAPKPLQQAGKEFKRSLDEMQKQVAQAQQKKAAEQAAQNQKPGQQKPTDPKQSAALQKQEEAQKKLQDALQKMAQAMANQSPQQMQQAMEQMAQQMPSNPMSPEQTQQMQQAMEQMAKALDNTQMQMAAQQAQQLAQRLQNMNGMSAQQQQQMANMMKQLAQAMGKGEGLNVAQLDAKTLAELMEALKEGRLTMAMGAGMGDKPGVGGKGPGKGFGAHGDPSEAMADPGDTKPRLLVQNQSMHGKGVGKNGSAQEFAKYLSQKVAPSKHLPNAKVAGDRSQNGQELSLSMTGNPDPTHSSSPYYQVYQTNRKQAETSLNKENIPAAYKEQVRKYFDSIHP